MECLVEKEGFDALQNSHHHSCHVTVWQLCRCGASIPDSGEPRLGPETNSSSALQGFQKGLGSTGQLETSGRRRCATAKPLCIRLAIQHEAHPAAVGLVSDTPFHHAPRDDLRLATRHSLNQSGNSWATPVASLVAPLTHPNQDFATLPVVRPQVMMATAQLFLSTPQDLGKK